mmetsp:Transcript_65646/g.136736  ORF Transcript_65646/g.136736 Transcript_65646/m.136736 type:complete len:117 (+) Transcript_65646:938-1288(+)
MRGFLEVRARHSHRRGQQTGDCTGPRSRNIGFGSQTQGRNIGLGSQTQGIENEDARLQGYCMLKFSSLQLGNDLALPCKGAPRIATWRIIRCLGSDSKQFFWMRRHSYFLPFTWKP